MVHSHKNIWEIVSHAALLFSGLGSIVLLFVLSLSQKIREDLARAAYRLFFFFFFTCGAFLHVA